MNYRQRIPGSYILKKKCDNNNEHTNDYINNALNNIEIKPQYKSCTQTQKHTIKIQKLESEILNKFEKQYDKHFANKILSAFDKVITEEEFDEIESISHDFENPTNSAILDSIWEDIEQDLTDPLNDKTQIIKTLLNIINSKCITFTIKTFTFVVNQHEVNKATKNAQGKAPSIFGHPTKGKMNISIAEDKSLCIAKAVDMKNGFPITKWLLEAFSRYRVLGHKILYEQFDGEFNEYDFVSDKYATGYNPTTWWLRDSVFCKYIQYKNAKMALPLMTAVQALSKRALPQLNFNPQTANVIHDNLNDFVKYIFASWSLVYKLKKERENEEIKCDIQSDSYTTQIDCWIIPQMVKPRKLASLFNLEDIFNEENDTLLSALNLNFVNNYSENICNKLGKVCMNKVQYPLWDLEQHLKQTGYIQNENYWVQYAQLDLNKIQEQMYEMLQMAKDHRYVERCIFIIDRRNADNLKHQNMGLKQANYFKGITKDFADKLYLIVPKQNGSTHSTTDLQSIPEIHWCRSKEFLFPCNGGKSEPIGIIDYLNGYKFVLSFHLSEINSSCVYWYSDAGSIKFELQDMEFLFSRYFNKINDKEQILTDNNCAILKKWMKEKQLKDIGFDNFWRQSNAMVLVYDNK